MDDGSQEHSVPFRVLVVCTANMCRSPLAEHLLGRAATEAGLPWSVSSAGVFARDGHPMHEHSAQVLEERGFVIGSWSSRRLNARLLDDNDVVLTATTQHRRQIVTAAPRAAGWTFPMLQFARLVASAGPPMSENGRGEKFEDWVLRARASVQPVAPSKEDIADPIGRPLRTFRACADLIDDAVGRIVPAAIRR